MRQKNVALFALTLFWIGLTGLQAQTVNDIEGNIYKTVTNGKVLIREQPTKQVLRLFRVAGVTSMERSTALATGRIGGVLRRHQNSNGIRIILKVVSSYYVVKKFQRS